MHRRGFTLIELLIVIMIVIVVSAVALPAILPAMQHRQVSEAARILQGALAGARDSAIRSNSVAGIRLIADPVTPNSCGSFMPLSQPPSYSEGVVSVMESPNSYPQAVLLGTTALVLEETVATLTGGILTLNSPTSWAWNVRLGDRIQINSAGPWYCVVGPVVTVNSEGFINYGPPGVASPIVRGKLNPEYLLLTNGRDDNANGWVDEGFDGVDNDGDGTVDNLGPIGRNNGEWEQETWLGSLAVGAGPLPYSIRRRPVPVSGAKAIQLPTDIVVDLSRSNLPSSSVVTQSTNSQGVVYTITTTILDLTVDPRGTISLSLPYAAPASLGLTSSFYQFWLAERSDMGAWQYQNGAPVTPLIWAQSSPIGNYWLVSANGRTGRVLSFDQPDLASGLSAARQQ